MIEFDVETTGLQPWSGKQRAFMYQFYDGANSEALLAVPENHDSIQAWFDRGDQEGIRAWNAKFDRAFADVAGYSIPGDGKWYDGMLVAHALNERRSVALKSVAKELYGDDAADSQKQVKTWLADERKRRAKVAKAEGTQLVEPNYSDVPLELMEPYGLEDVYLTKRISDGYQSVLDQSPDLAGVYEFERKTMDALYAIEKRGLPARRSEYHKLKNEVLQNLETLDERVRELVAEGDPSAYARQLSKSKKNSVDPEEAAKLMGEFNPASSAQIHAALVARGADLTYMSEKDGKLSMDADNLRAVHDDLAAAILNFRTEYKVLSTYVNPMIEPSFEPSIRVTKEPFISEVDSRIHTNYRQVGARTGRMSSSDPNVQNQPRDDLRLRYNIVAEPGYKLVTCDLTNIEMYIFAAYCGEGRLLDAVNSGADLHVLTAKMLGLRDRARPGGGIETARQLGKTYNFSRIYGGGLRTIKRSFRCSMDEARLLKKRFDDAYPEVARLSTRIQYRLEEDGYISDVLSGRRFRVDPRDAYKATNYLVQGTAASLLKYAMVKLHADGVPMVALVHDEIVAHVPEADAVEARNLIIERLTEHEGLKGVVPLKADGDIVDRWSDAKPLKDENGRAYYFDPAWAGVEERRYVKAA
jgi:DNA polymerase I-like protein with 3'-5' exonuclease and polymerase domains